MRSGTLAAGDRSLCWNLPPTETPTMSTRRHDRTSLSVTDRDIADYRRDGAVCLRGLFADWVDTIAAGIERNMRDPGPYAAESVRSGEAGSFFDDYCNWQRIAEFRELVERSPAAEVAARIMGSQSAQFF